MDTKYYKNWETEMMVSLHTKKVKGLINDFKFSFNSPINNEWEKKSQNQKIPKDFIEFYKLYEGLSMEWSAPNNIGGEIQFLEMKYVLQDWKGILYDENDLIENDLLEFYKPFCQISETYSCGFIITPDFVSKSIHVHNAPNPEINVLDINFNGFLKMAKASEIYYYWPKVLLDIQFNKESPESESMKANLSKIFPDFNDKSYVQLYNSLRLSKPNSKIDKN